MTFLYVLPYVLVYFVEKLYVPIRSVQQYLHFASFLRHAFFSPSGPLSSQGTCYAVPIRAVYVPIRAVSPNHFGICLWPAGAPPPNPCTFLYVLCNRLNKLLQSCPETIRSYTFRATLAQLCETLIRSYTFLLRSYTFFHTFFNIL